MAKRELIGTFEQLVMLSLLRLRQDAYGLQVRDEIAIRTGLRPSLGAAYTTLERLESKGSFLLGKARRRRCVVGAPSDTSRLKRPKLWLSNVPVTLLPT